MSEMSDIYARFLASFTARSKASLGLNVPHVVHEDGVSKLVENRLDATGKPHRAVITHGNNSIHLQMTIQKTRERANQYG